MNRQQYLARLREPSTWAGLAILLGLFGIELAPAETEQFITTGAGFAGLLAVFLREKGQ